MKTYKVIWEVSKEAKVYADNKEDTIEHVMSGEVREFEREITTPPEAFEVKET